MIKTKSQYRNALFGKNSGKLESEKFGCFHVAKNNYSQEKYVYGMKDTKMAYIEGFLLDNRGLSPENVKRLLRAIHTIQNVWGIVEPDEDSAVRLKRAMRERGRRSSSIAYYLWAMRYWALSQGRDINFHAVPLPKVERTIPKIIDYAIIRRMLNEDTLTLRDRVLVLIFSLSPRLGEVVTIKVSDIDHVTRTILIHDHKGSKQKILPVPDAYWGLLKSYLSARQSYLDAMGVKCDYLFVSERGARRLGEDGVRAAIYRIGKTYHIEGLHCHLFRHTAISFYLECGLSPVEVMAVSGHSTLKCLQIYTQHRDSVVRQKVQALAY